MFVECNSLHRVPTWTPHLSKQIWSSSGHNRTPSASSVRSEERGGYCRRAPRSFASPEAFANLHTAVPGVVKQQHRKFGRTYATTTQRMASTVVPDWYDGPPSLYEDLPVAKALGPKGSREEFESSQGYRLASYFFPAKSSAKALAIVIHGHGCSLQHEFLHSETPGKPAVYKGSIIEQLNDAGFAVAGIDLQGCGHSSGVRCYVDRYKDYVQDVLDFTRSIDSSKRPGFAGLSKFAIGASLGGCISIDLGRSSDTFKGAVLIAPMLSLEKISNSGLNPYLRYVAGFISWLLPRAQIAKTERSPISPTIQAFFDEDPQMWHGWTRARNAQEYLMTTEALCAEMNTITIPFICFHGEIDTMTDPEGSKKLYDEAQSTDKELQILPERWHVLLKEPGCKELGLKVVEWLQKRA